MSLRELAARISPFSRFFDLEKELTRGKTVVLDGCEHDALKTHFYSICLSPTFVDKSTVDLNQGPRNHHEFYSFGGCAVDFERVRRITGPHPYHRIGSAADLDKMSVDPHFGSKISSAVASRSKLVVDLMSCQHIDDQALELKDRCPTLPGVLCEALAAIRDGVKTMKRHAEKPLCAVDMYDRDETAETISILEELRRLEVPMLIFRTSYAARSSSDSRIRSDVTLLCQSTHFPSAGVPISAQLSPRRLALVRNPRRRHLAK